MPKKWTHTQAFAHFGTKPKNVQWSWSARNATTKIVVVTLWQDLFKTRGVYDWPAGVGQGSLGFAELMDNLAWAQTHCGGRFHVISAIAKDPAVEPRSIKECFPTGMIMRLTHLDTTTGAFSAEPV